MHIINLSQPTLFDAYGKETKIWLSINVYPDTQIRLARYFLYV
jgi:hypothetical protein